MLRTAKRTTRPRTIQRSRITARVMACILALSRSRLSVRSAKPQAAIQLHQLRYRLAVIEHIHGPSTPIGERLAWVDAHRVIERAKHLRRRDFAVLGMFAARAAAADGLTHLQPAARNERGHDRRP